MKGKPEQKKEAKSKRAVVEIAPPRYDDLVVEIFGVSDLIQEHFSTKARKAIEDKHQGKATAPREMRDPSAEYEALKYRLPDGRDAMKSAAFQESCIFTAPTLPGLYKTTVKSAIRVLDFLIPIQSYEVRGKKIIRRTEANVRMVTDEGKDANGGFRIMYRPYYANWRVLVRIRFRPDLMTAEQIVNLLNHSGFSSGVGAHRPSSPKKSGPFGMFTTSEAQLLRALESAEKTA